MHELADERLTRRSGRRHCDRCGARRFVTTWRDVNMGEPADETADETGAGGGA
jgi:hypothetical protein